jgi:hypothetical protein
MRVSRPSEIRQIIVQVKANAASRNWKLTAAELAGVNELTA